MPALYLLDTDSASYSIKRHPAGLERKLQSIPSEHLAISAVTHGELLFRLQSLDAEHRLHFLVHAFLRTIRTLDWDVPAARRYAEVRHRLRVAGQVIGEQDTMIAAHALSLNATLVTNNVRHFQRVGPELRLENWTRF
jgi:tRNA(fMet)-specific endonuclease VapC